MKIKTRRYYIYYALKLFLYISRLIPRNISLFIADLLGKAAFMLLGKYRNIAISNLDSVFEGRHEENVKLARDVFRNMAMIGVDWLKLMSMDKKDVIGLVTETSGLENLDRALEGGKGVIVMVSHFGNWELLSAYTHSMGYRGTIIAKRIYFHKYDQMIVGIRKRFGANLVYRDESPKKMFRALKDGQILGMLADQDVESVEGVFVKFFGKDAYTPTGPVKIGMIAGVDILPAFMIRKADNTYKFVVEKPIVLSREGDKEDNVRKYTQEWTDVLERYVKEYPDQWVWIHNRWKTKKV